ncbi:hypothetical protein RvY_11040 [Ramazzottius varieornatus]|uniref:Uncharacterized protein n=1 Tax=Ramazzottius varieornatus TaxID=947166 RepID=A0A1D1VEU8_RAMVA|nr:hypothetical protein RvY_11040 [Ramazzottius varieornatus]
MAAPEIISPADAANVRPPRAANKAAVHVTDEMCVPLRNISWQTSGQEDCTNSRTVDVNPLIAMGVAKFTIGLGATTTRILGLKAELDGNTLRRLSVAIGGPDKKPNDGKNATTVSLKGYVSFMQMFLKQQYQLPQSVSSSGGGNNNYFGLSVLY